MKGRARRLGAAVVAGLLTAAGAGLLAPGAPHTVAAAASDEAPSLYVDPAHDSRQPSDSLTPGLALRWSQHFDNWVSYPVVWGGRAYFTVVGPAAGSTAPGVRLYAVDAATGAAAWGPVSIPFSMANSAMRQFSGIAYDGGHVYVMGGDMVLRAYDAGSGSLLWSDTLGDPTCQTGDCEPGIPTATGGLVYLVTGYTHGTLHAIDGATGTSRWTAARDNGHPNGAVAVAGGIVYDAGWGVPGHAYNAATGAPLWNSSGTTAGGAVATQAYGGYVFGRAVASTATSTGQVLNAGDGSTVRADYAHEASTFDGSTEYSLWQTTLEARDLAAGTLKWSFAGDNVFATTPIAVNGYVYVGDSNGTLYAVDEATGHAVWSTATGIQLSVPADATLRGDEGPTQTPVAAEGLLMVPGKTDLVVYGSGGPPAAPTPTIPARTANHADEATTVQIDRGHDGVQTGDSLQSPLVRAWNVDLPGILSYPVIADGRLFVIAAPASGTAGPAVYGFDAATGRQLWGPLRWPGNAVTSLAYDRNRLLVSSPNPGILRALDPATGNLAWSRAYPRSPGSTNGEGLFGAVTVDGAGRVDGVTSPSGASVSYETDRGGLLGIGSTGPTSISTVAVSDTLMFASHECQDVFAVTIGTLAQAWRHSSTCSGAGSPMPVLHGGRLYVRDPGTPDGPVLDASSGSRTGTLLSDLPEAVDDTTAFAVRNGALEAHSAGDQSLRWSFSGDSAFTSAPLVANGAVYAGTAKGTLYALAETSGAVLWQDATGGSGFLNDSNRPPVVTGNAIAEGLFAAASGSRLVVYRSASAPTPPPPPPPAPGPGSGGSSTPPGPSCTPVDAYRMVAVDGGIFDFNGAEFRGSMGGQRLNAPIVGMAATPSGHGYWLVASDGGIFAFGDAPFAGSMGGQRLNAPIVAMAATPSGGGYWMVASDGGIFAFGDAVFAGSTGGTRLNAPIVGMAATPSGHGYWLVASDGGVFTFGDAAFAGSMGGHRLNAPISGMASTPSGSGYWMVAPDGGVFAFGDAVFAGSMGGHRLNAPISGMAATPSGHGYWMVATDGGIFTFGDALFAGSMGAHPLNAAIAGMGAQRECL
ncbi:MAG TPA: PQQ-binding-like beta-propeller repeat protein [Candidatus Dormibacteraeota bacterium]|jgi:outer membrane protein assembly factor BamB|nr:PQQ-binding-like beta-propeller repeat protein [Candidatus Dormibacteraeota bacterium]